MVCHILLFALFYIQEFCKLISATSANYSDNTAGDCRRRLFQDV